MGASHRDDHAPISFPEWSSVLHARHPSLAERYRREIVAFLRACRERHTPASIAFAREYLAALSGARSEAAREALRWFVRQARQERQGIEPANEAAAAHTAADRSDRSPRSLTPPLAREDLGSAIGNAT